MAVFYGMCFHVVGVPILKKYAGTFLQKEKACL
jgi:hypothetical protein